MRINRAIAALEAGRPVFYTGGHSGAELTYEAGLGMASTWADYINVGMEHGAFDMAGLDEFMRGLAEGAGTAGTPAVLVELPMDGSSAEGVRMNAWQCRQILARGVHGLLLCHAESPEAVKAFVQACRFPFQTIGVGDGLDVGRRGSGGQGSAAPIWGLTADEYLQKADPWPLNPQGELLLGLKIENRRALARVEETLSVPGIAFAEWGPADMSMSFGYRSIPPEPRPPELTAARNQVFDACRASGVAFLEGATLEDVAAKIDEGVRIFPGSEEVARAGRAHAEKGVRP
jgi:4-hydroxy-2-oxoheptanedioate aldolase